MKKIILILGIIASFNAQATDSGSCASENTDSTCTWNYNSETKTLTISGAGDMADYLSGDAPWYEYAHEIKSLNIGHQITHIGDISFWNCSEIENITFETDSNGQSSLTSIGRWGFSEMGLLQHLIIPDSVTSISGFAFALTEGHETTPLKSIVLPSSLENIDYHIFGWCAEGETSCRLNNTTVYCPQTKENVCTSALTQSGLTQQQTLDILQTYTKDGNGFYQIDDKLYATADLMTKDAPCDNAQNCRDILDAASQGKSFEVGGKYYATLDLFANKKSCENQSQCEEMLSASKQNAPFIVGGKFYASLDDFLTGNYVKHRIYTIDEANRVAGEKNRVSITYR